MALERSSASTRGVIRTRRRRPLSTPHSFVGSTKRDWVPDADGNLHAPKLVVFDTLGWKPNPFLQSKIRFKPPIIDQLAKEAGIEPGVLDLLKKLGVTSEADLRARLGVKEDTDTSDGEPEGSVDGRVEEAAR